ncbi:MAG TPA: hypothetical protein VH640_24620 [Bryobacteraceae bacterium]
MKSGNLASTKLTPKAVADLGLHLPQVLQLFTRAVPLRWYRMESGISQNLAEYSLAMILFWL